MVYVEYVKEGNDDSTISLIKLNGSAQSSMSNQTTLLVFSLIALLLVTVQFRPTFGFVKLGDGRWLPKDGSELPSWLHTNPEMTYLVNMDLGLLLFSIPLLVS